MTRYIEFDVKINGSWTDYLLIDIEEKKVYSTKGNTILTNEELQVILNILRKLKVINDAGNS